MITIDAVPDLKQETEYLFKMKVEFSVVQMDI